MRASLFLVHKMSLGYGVSVVVDNIARRLNAQGWKCIVGCLDSDGSFSGYPIYEIKPNIKELNLLASMLANPVIVAHTSPFFELLPMLAEQYPCFAWEHGDPTPDFFFDDRDMRVQVITNKRNTVYGKISGVIAISEFIQHDISWPKAQIIYNGCNHAPEMGTKDFGFFNKMKGKPLRVGTLMRLGKGEAKYKGNDLFLELVAMLRSRAEVEVIPAIMGRGKAADAEAFRKQGFEVYLNSPDHMKWEFLRRLDVFISPSLWEGFNLPLVEAQALGTVAIAFDTGSHPEVTPYICSSLKEACFLIERFANNRSLLPKASHSAYHFVRKHFSWEKTCEDYKRILLGITGNSDSMEHIILKVLNVFPYGHKFCSLSIKVVNLSRSIKRIFKKI